MTLALPARATGATMDAYEAAILGAVKGNPGDAATFVKLTSGYKNHHGEFWVTSDALMVDGFRPGMGARLLQQCADVLSCTLMTPKVLDLMFQERAVTVLPVTYSMLGYGVGDIDRIDVMRAASAEIDRRKAAAGYKNGIVMNGKPFVVDMPRPLPNGKMGQQTASVGENYGWYVDQSPGNWLGVSTYPTVTGLAKSAVIQQPGWAHNLSQNDYASLGYLLHRQCTVDGQGMDTLDVMTSPELYGLLSDNGPMQWTRQPGVPCLCTGAKTSYVAPSGDEHCPLVPLIAPGSGGGGAPSGSGGAKGVGTGLIVGGVAALAVLALLLGKK